MEIKEGVFDDEAVMALIERHLDHCQADTPPGKCHRLDLSGLQRPDIRFWTLWDGEQAVGCIALRDLGEGRGELKSMHVLAERRGEGLADILLNHLLDEARKSGMTWLGLETGDTPLFEAARVFYAKRGFAPTAEFGDYTAQNAGPLMARAIGILAD